MRNIERLIEELAAESAGALTTKLVVAYDSIKGSYRAILLDVDHLGNETVLMDPNLGEHALVGRAGTLHAALEHLDDLCVTESN